MTFSPVSVIANALRLRRTPLWSDGYFCVGAAGRTCQVKLVNIISSQV